MPWGQCILVTLKTLELRPTHRQHGKVPPAATLQTTMQHCLVPLCVEKYLAIVMVWYAGKPGEGRGRGVGPGGG